MEDARQQVSERAEQRWDLLMRGQVEKAYEYYSPTTRSTLSIEVFRKRAGATRWWRSMKLDKVDCRPDACQVTIEMVYDLKEIKGLKRSIEETWVKEGGTWWLVSAN